MLRIAVLIVVLVAAVGGYLYVFDRPRLERMMAGTPLELPPTTTEVYKWRDKAGNWQITDHRPPEGTDYETLTYRSNDNIMPLAPVDE